MIKRTDRTNVITANEFDPSLYKNNAHIVELAQICRQHNIQLIIVEMPTWKISQHSNETGLIEIEDYFILDANNQKFVDVHFVEDKHWTSINHLNVSGSETLSKLILQNFVEKNILN